MPTWCLSQSCNIAHLKVFLPCLRAGETANGAFPTQAVQTMAAIVTNAETANSYYRCGHRAVREMQRSDPGTGWQGRPDR